MKPDPSTEPAPTHDDHHLVGRQGDARANERTEALIRDGDAPSDIAAQRGRAAVSASLEAAAFEASQGLVDDRHFFEDTADPALSRDASAHEAPLPAEQERRRALAAALEPNAPPANDDLASLGAAFKSIGSRSRTATMIGAAVATILWLLSVGVIYLGGSVSNQVALIAMVGLTGVYAIVLMAIFITARMTDAQATTRSLVKIVAGLANPDTISTTRAGAMSQAVKNEIAAIDASLDQTFARAANLEAALRTEYRDFERAFAEKEQQFQAFLDSMSSERASIVTNAEKVRSAIAGAHQNLSRDLDEASQRFARIIGEAGATLSATIDHKSADMARAAAEASDRCAAKLDHSLEGSIIRASDLVESRGDKFAALLANKGNDLDEKLSARMKDASDLLERQIKDAQDKAAFRLDAMASQIDKLLKKMDTGIGERGEAINAMLATRTIDIARTLKDTGNEFRQTLDRTTAVTSDFNVKAQTLNAQMSQQIGRLNDAIVVPLGMVAASIDEKGRILSTNLADRFTKIDSMLTGQSNRLDALLDNEIETLKITLDGSIEAIKAVLGSGSANLKGSLADRAQKIEAVLSERLAAFSALITENRTRLAFELSSHTQSLDNMLDRQRGLLTDLSDQRPAGTSQTPLRISAERRPTPDRFGTDRSGSERPALDVQLPPASLVREIRSRAETVPARPGPATGSLRDRLNAIDGAQAAQRPREPSPRDRAPYTNIGPSSLPPISSVRPHPSASPTAAPRASLPPLPASMATSTPNATSVPSPALRESAGPSVSAPRAPVDDAAKSKTWLSDLLARASIDEDAILDGTSGKPNYQDAPISSIAANVGTFIKSDELQAAWERYNSGAAGDFQRIYTPKGAVMQLKIKQRLVEDVELRQAVGSYVTEFERLLQEVHQDNSDDLIFEYLHTDAGKVYTMLAHASNRLGGG